MANSNIGSAYILLMPSFQGFEAKIKSELDGIDVSSIGDKMGSDIGDGIGDGIGKATKATSGFTGKMAALSGAIGGVASNIAGSLFDAVAGLSGEMVAAADSSQKFASTLGFAGIDTSTIEQLTASTQEYADRTVYDLNDIRNATAQLAANGVDNYAQLAEAAGNLNAVAGGNADTYRSIGMVMSQTAGQGKLVTENWNQLTDAIPGASGALQEAMRAAGAFEGNFRDAMANGEISADEFFAAVQQLGMQDVAVQAATSTSTIEGAMGNLEASVVGVGSQVVTALTPMLTWAMSQVSGLISGVPSAIAPVAQAISDIFSNIDAGGAIQTLSDALSSLWSSLQNVGGSFLSVISGLTGISTPADAAAAATGALNAIVGILEPVIRSISDALSFLAQNMDVVVPVLAGLTSGFIAFKAATAISGAITAVQNAMNGMSVAQYAVATAQRIVNTVMNANPFVLIATLIAGVVTALVTLFNTNETFRGIVISAWSAIQTAAEEVWGAVVEFFTVTVPQAIESLTEWFSQLPGNIAEFLSEILSNAASWAGSMAEDARKAGSDFLNNVVNFVTQLPGRIAEFLSNIIGSVSGWVSDMGSKAASAGRDFLEESAGKISELPGRIAGSLSDIIGRVGGWVGEMAGKARDAGVDFFNNVVNEIGKIPDRVRSIGEDIVRGVWNGITGMGGWIAEKVGGFFGGLIDDAKAALGIASPSKEFAKIGGFTMQGLALGIENAASEPVKAMRGAVADISDIAPDAGDLALRGSYPALAAEGGLAADADLLGRILSTLVEIYGVIPEGMDARTFGRRVRRAVSAGAI